MDDPLWMQNVTYTGKEDRGLIAALFDEGVENWRSFKVTQRALGATMSVDIAAGRAIVTGDDQADQFNYLCRETTAPTNLAIAAQGGATTRFDKVVLRVNDPDAGGPAGNNSTLAVIQGTAGSPGVAPATPSSAILLATIGPISISTANIIDSMITDGRTLWGERMSPPGTIKMTAGTHVPNGWLAADGSAQSRTGLADLFAEIGTSYGVGNGTTTFNLPDGRGKVLVPQLVGQAQVTTVGATGGAYTKVLVEANLPPHAHAVNINSGNNSADHYHPPGSLATNSVSAGLPVMKIGTTGNIYAAGSAQSAMVYTGVDSTGFSGNMAGHSHAVSSGTTDWSGQAHYHNVNGNTGNGNGASTAVDVMQPYQVIGLAIIRT